MTKSKGGRGKKLPYETEVIRIPKALIPAIKELTEVYESVHGMRRFTDIYEVENSGHFELRKDRFTSFAIPHATCGEGSSCLLLFTEGAISLETKIEPVDAQKANISNLHRC